MLKVGIIGLGFMGKMHFRCFKALENVQLVAVCDIDPQKLISTEGVAGNIAGAEQPLDFTGIKLYTDAREMLRRNRLDIVSITLPTYLHAEYAIRALNSGANVFCEKPMALNPRECKRMIGAARRRRKRLQVGHCIRFWPEYEKLRALIQSGQYGALKTATFQRLSHPPIWNWQNWMMDGAKSGGAALDLHIHDADIVQHLFGFPKQVFSRGVRGPSGDYDHMVTQYLYGNEDRVITAEGGWMYNEAFGFEMSFNVAFEHATLFYNNNFSPALRIFTRDGEVQKPALESGDAYFRELRYFSQLVGGAELPEVITPEDSMDAVRLIMAEKKSAQSGKPIRP